MITSPNNIFEAHGKRRINTFLLLETRSRRLCFLAAPGVVHDSGLTPRCTPDHLVTANDEPHMDHMEAALK